MWMARKIQGWKWYTMESLHSFTLAFRNAVRLSFAVRPSDPLKTVRHFSTRGKPPSVENGPPNGVSQEETSSSSAQARLPSNRKPLRGHPSCKDPSLRSKFWRAFRTKAEAPSQEEFMNLRNDDFPQVKQRLQQKASSLKRTEGTEILFGIAPCSLALQRSKRIFFQMFLKTQQGSPSSGVKEFSRHAKDHGIPVKMVQRKVLDDLCKGGVHQGVCLEATPLHPIGWQEGPSPEAEGVPLHDGSQSLWLALEGIQDPMNLGAVLRSAHFLGMDGIVMSRKNSCPLTPVVSKASSGTMEILDVFSTDDLQSLLKAKSERGWEVVGTVGHAKAEEDVPIISCLDFRWTRPTVLLLGNEGYGLSLETRRLCQKMLTISPGRELQPGIESLNVSVAAGILLHSICSQKNK
ncbi:rRNA methyltransferase 1, mitochondrial [Elgaria multicarinata webbii]|uniref:rRNA methyltransferase 1, mitochondrial n=1 Tax=Elgaria multicarinata webbii TaxID=159646 RepID=UPI002FCD53C5